MSILAWLLFAGEAQIIGSRINPQRGHSEITVAKRLREFAREKLANPLILCDDRQSLGGASMPWPDTSGQEGVAMRLVALAVAICGLSQTAFAQPSECRAIADADTRLACYDRYAAPAVPSAAARPASRTAPVPKSDGGSYVDSIGAEDALMNARLRNICRGC